MTDRTTLDPNTPDSPTIEPRGWNPMWGWIGFVVLGVAVVALVFIFGGGETMR